MRNFTVICAAALVCGTTTSALAQEAVTADARVEVDATADTTDPGAVRAPRRAFEIGVQGGYTQPFGEIKDGQGFTDLVDAGGFVGLMLGYRFTPHWSIEGTGAFHESTADSRQGDRLDIRGVTTGVQGTFHARPYERVDPYVSLGAGYRMLFLVPDNDANLLIHGFELAKALVGVDFRVSEDVALGPVVGADLNLFVWENGSPDVNDDDIDNPRPSTFLFAGVAGKFDIGGDRVTRNGRVTTAVATPAAGPLPPAKRDLKRPPPTAIQIDKRIMELCKIEQKKAYFEFDKANVLPADQATLEQVAQCFVSGPLKGYGLDIVGRTDPRGPDDYNQQLGQSRADAVSEYLTTQGMTGAKISSESAGEAGATGTNETEWAYDRRVDLRLIDPATGLPKAESR